jgi:hypothetical protein
MRNTIHNKAFIILNSQFDRRFVPFLSICGSKFLLIVCDRAGVVQSVEYDLDTDAIIFLKVLAAFLFGSRIAVGLDPSMRRGANDEIKGITVGNVEYHVVKRIFSSESLRGRATQCWKVQCGDQEFVIKDTWIQTGRKNSEIDILFLVAGIPCVPTIVHGEDLKLSDGVLDSTGIIRANQNWHEERIHRRIVMKPVGESIFKFESKKELIGTLIDVTTGMCPIGFFQCHAYHMPIVPITHRPLFFST